VTSENPVDLTAPALVRRYLHDQDGMPAIGALPGDLHPPEAFRRGRYHRLLLSTVSNSDKCNKLALPRGVGQE
jgi:hypothetical protein